MFFTYCFCFLQFFPFSNLETIDNFSHSSFAYVTLLSSDNYFPGTAALVKSLQLTGTKLDIVVLTLPHISWVLKSRLCQLGIIVIETDYIENPYEDLMISARQKYNFSKLRIWQLEQYFKVIFIDSDSIVLKNIDHLFMIEFSGIAAVLNYYSPFSLINKPVYFNSGFMLIKTNGKVFKQMVESFQNIVALNGGDQGFLNQFFTNFTILDQKYNVNKIMFKYSKEDFPKEIYVLHFVRKKPWLDVIKQYERNGRVMLFDSPDDYELLYKEWRYFNAIVNLENIKFSQSPNEYCSSSICMFIYSYFCPFSFTLMCSEVSEPDITLATQLSFDRLDRLLRMIREWHGPISAAIFIGLDDVFLVMKKLMFENIPWGRVDIHLVSSNTTTFPINILRNIAVNNSRTDMVFYLDVDFITMPDLHKKLTTFHKYKHVWALSRYGHVHY